MVLKPHVNQTLSSTLLFLYFCTFLSRMFRWKSQRFPCISFTISSLGLKVTVEIRLFTLRRSNGFKNIKKKNRKEKKMSPEARFNMILRDYCEESKCSIVLAQLGRSASALL